nr:MAG TPA: hypothetical protein [Caudoviricetes sp.]
MMRGYASIVERCTERKSDYKRIFSSNDLL